MKRFNYTVRFVSVLLIVAGCGGGGSSRTVLQNKGSDTLVNVAQAWAEAYRDVDPNVAIAVTGGGSGTGIASLINGTVDIANSSRSIKDSELKQAQANGQHPVEFVVGYDALAVYVHESNPIDSLTVEQLAAIYGEGGEVESWSDLGIEVPRCSGQEIIRVSRQNNSGTYAYFREAVLDNNDFKLGSRDMHGSIDVVELVESTACAIGYSGIAYATEHVKTVPVSFKGAKAIPPSPDSAIDGTYPIARPLFMYTAQEPVGVVKEYIDWILSDTGQCIILEKGYAAVRPVTCP